MKYFEFIFVVLFLFLSILPVAHFLYNLKIRHFVKLVFKATGKYNFAANFYLPFFHLSQITAFLCKKNEKKALAFLCVGRISPAVRVLKKYHKNFWSIVLSALKNQQIAITQLEDFILKHPKDHAAIAELALLYFVNGNKNKVLQCLNNLPIKGKKNHTLALTLYLQAFFDADDGDLLSASVHANQAALIFQKINAAYEEAQAYALMGILYRTAVMPDMAQMMFDTAVKIFKSIHFEAGIAQTFGNLGMLMAIQKRFDEALDYYDKAFNLFLTLKQEVKTAEILNQKSLLFLMQNDFVQAQNLASLALVSHQKYHNHAGMAFSKEILAQVAWNLKDYSGALELAFEAKNLYLNLENYSAFYENLYLMALVYFEQNKLDEAEKVLREITKKIYDHSSNFHAANAYNLLGLIYLRKKDLRRAKGLFKQSLDLELVNNRFSGIATDYTNISLIEFETGNVEQALKTIDLALQYAKTQQDDELIEIIQQQMNRMSKT